MSSGWQAWKYTEGQYFAEPDATIEHLRSELMNAVVEDNFSSGAILELSQRLDHYIVMAQNQMLGK